MDIGDLVQPTRRLLTFDASNGLRPLLVFAGGFSYRYGEKACIYVDVMTLQLVVLNDAVPFDLVARCIECQEGHHVS